MKILTASLKMEGLLHLGAFDVINMILCDHRGNKFVYSEAARFVTTFVVSWANGPACGPCRADWAVGSTTCPQTGLRARQSLSNAATVAARMEGGDHESATKRVHSDCMI